MSFQKEPHHSHIPLIQLLYKYFCFGNGINFREHGMNCILLAQGGAVDSEESLRDEQRLVRDNRSQSVCEQPGLQRTLGEPVTRNLFGVDRAAQGGGIGVRTSHRGDDRSRAMPFGHPVFMPAYIRQDQVGEPNQT